MGSLRNNDHGFIKRAGWFGCRVANTEGSGHYVFKENTFLLLFSVPKNLMRVNNNKNVLLLISHLRNPHACFETQFLSGCHDWHS